MLVGHRAVLHLEHVEEREHRLEEDLGSLAHPVRLEEVVGGVEEVLGPEVVDELEDAPALPVDDGVLLPGQVEDVDVDPVARLREPGLHLDRDEEVGQVGVAVLEPQAPLDRVVVGEGDEVHPAGLREPVDLLRVVVGVVAVGRLEVLEDGGVRVDVEVGPRKREGGRRGRSLGPRSPGVFGHRDGVSPAGGPGSRHAPLLKSGANEWRSGTDPLRPSPRRNSRRGGVDLVLPVRPRQGGGGPRPDREVRRRGDRAGGRAGPARRRRPFAGSVRRGDPRPPHPRAESRGRNGGQGGPGPSGVPLPGARDRPVPRPRRPDGPDGSSRPRP